MDKKLNHFIHTTWYHHLFRYFGEKGPVKYNGTVFYLMFDKNDTYLGCGIWKNGEYGYSKFIKDKPDRYIIYGGIDHNSTMKSIRNFKKNWKKYLNKNDTHTNF